MIDAFIAEALAAGGCLWFVMAAWRRSALPRRSAVPPIGGSIAQLPFRYRREARAIIAMAREHLSRHTNASVEAFTARETLRSYLPDTIAAYLAVPPALRQNRRGCGPSADELLGRQLLTLRSGIERLREADAEIGAARMAENGAFLNERFGAPAAPIAPPQTSSIVTEIVHALSSYLRRT